MSQHSVSTRGGRELCSGFHAAFLNRNPLGWKESRDETAKEGSRICSEICAEEETAGRLTSIVINFLF